MYAVRAITVFLSSFVLVYACVFALVRCGWPLWRRLGRSVSARTLANLLFSLQIAPMAVAGMAVALFVAPSFLRLEPHATDEGLGAVPLLLATAATLLLGTGVLRAFVAWRRTARASAAWVRESRIAHYGAPLRVYQTHGSGLIAVSGLRNQKLFVSSDLTAVLDPKELERAIAHEMVHAKRRDNLAKLLVTLCGVAGADEIRRAWLHALELTADEAAVTRKAEALDLASALVKVSRQQRQVIPELASGLADSSPAPLSERVERLLAWHERREQQAWRLRWPAVATCMALAIAAVVSYHSILLQVHTFTEWLVR
jgi:Zn-dependent protease with chaperone function